MSPSAVPARLPWRFGRGRFPLRVLAIIAVYAVCWYAFDRAAQALEVADKVSIWNPPMALDITLLLVCGLRFTPVVLLGVVIDQWLVTAQPWPLPVLLVVGLIRVAGFGGTSAVLLHGLRIDPCLRRLRDVVWFVIGASLVGALLGAMLQNAVLTWWGIVPRDAWLQQTLLLWSGVATGVVVFTPALLLLLRWVPWLWSTVHDLVPPQFCLRRLTRRALADLGVAAVGVVVGVVVAYGTPRAQDLDYTYVVAFPLVWIAVRYAFTGAVWGVVAINLGAALLVAGQIDQRESFALQLGLMVVSQGGLLLGAFMREQQHAHAERLKLERALMEAQRTESIGRLARGVAHDFNNLLQVIRGHIQVAIVDVGEQVDPVDSLQEADRAVQRAADVAQQLLAAAGEGRVRTDRIDLNALVRDMITLLRPSLPKNVAVRMEPAPILPTVTADGTQLRQVVMNLVLNAAEAMHGSAGTITIGTSIAARHDVINGVADATPIAEAEEFACLSVADTGWGMDADTITQIFEPFFSTKEHGHGLGLSMVHGIVRGHGGGLHVESRPGAGATFRVWLPANAVPTLPLPPLVAGSAQERRSVLVVDDDPAVGRLAEHILTRWGYDVTLQPDGARAVEWLGAHRDMVSCVLLDQDMPGMNGLDTARALRRMLPTVPLIFMSGRATDEQIARMAALGANGMLHKPFTLDDLADALRRARPV